MQGPGTAGLGPAFLRSEARNMAKRTTKKTTKKSARKAKRKTGTARKRKGRKGRRWSQQVTETSDALTLEDGVFTKSTSRKIALSLKRSAEKSHRRKSDPYRSTMSMLTFYINRAGKALSKSRKAKLQKAKDELRELYGKG